MPKFERIIEAILFQSRWTLAPFYLGLAFCLLLMLFHFGRELIHFVARIPTATEADVVLGILSLIDLTFTANLVLIVIFSGYENFVSKFEKGDQDRPDWVELRDRIGHNVLEYGWHDEARAYTVAYGDEEMDASSLWIGLSGLLPDDDPRFLSTVLKVESDLRSGPVVYRYHWNDGLPGREGGFHICTAWLIDAYLRTGRRGDAEELFQQMIDTAGPTGLLPEQYDPISERGLGNHPHAYSHLGLIRCGLLLDATAG